jgi:hypothetical protein
MWLLLQFLVAGCHIGSFVVAGVCRHAQMLSWRLPRFLVVAVVAESSLQQLRYMPWGRQGCHKLVSKEHDIKLSLNVLIRCAMTASALGIPAKCPCAGTAGMPQVSIDRT